MRKIGNVVAMTLGLMCLLTGAQAVAQSSNSCAVVGIKPEGVFYAARDRTCFANSRSARRRGFISIAETSAIKGFSFALTGAEEVPPVTTSASGTCVAALLADKVSLQLICTHTIADPVSAHVHEGAVGVAGGILCPLTAASPISATCVLTKAQVRTLLDGGLYVNVHTAANPSGEIRGQIE